MKATTCQMPNGRRARLWVLVGGILCATQLYADGGGFTLTDYLGHAWTNEAVRFPIAGSDLKRAQAGAALVGPAGTPGLISSYANYTQRHK